MKYIKYYNLFESNITANSEEELLQKYFGLTSEEVKDWFQDLLDEWTELDFQIEVITDKKFGITFLDLESTNNYKIGKVNKSKHIISPEFIQYISNRLEEYDCYIVKQDGDYVFYDTKKRLYLDLIISKKSKEKTLWLSDLV
jgi:hypothetical protein